MRAAWLQILFISAALHLMVGVAILLASAPASTRASIAQQTVSMTFQLRSESNVSQTITSTPSAHAEPFVQPKSNRAVAVVPAKVPTAPIVPAASTNSFALKDAARAQVRPLSDAVLCPSTPATVDCRNGVVFILDISGSMYEAYDGTTRLNLGRELIGVRIRALPEGTPFALVVYGETARRSGPLVPANDATRRAALEFLGREYDCGGGTNLPAGLSLARELETGSILVATDGDLNMSPSELLPKARRILGAADSCPALTIVAIDPRPSTKDELLLRELAHQQAGTYLSANEENLTDPAAPKRSDLAAR